MTATDAKHLVDLAFCMLAVLIGAGGTAWIIRRSR